MAVEIAMRRNYAAVEWGRRLHMGSYGYRTSRMARKRDKKKEAKKYRGAGKCLCRRGKQNN
jgi:hypothetical protein